MPIIRSETGDIFTAPPNSVLIHSCNALGAWGAGVALEFKRRFPEAFKIYNTTCLSHRAPTLLGTCLLIPSIGVPIRGKPLPTDDNQYYIACLITSHRFGKSVDTPEQVVSNTRRALADLERQLKEARASGETVGECYAVRINAGGFKVPWEESRKVFEEWGVEVGVRDRDVGV